MSFARGHDINQKAFETMRIQLWKTVNGVKKELDLTGYTGSYAASHLLEDTPAKARIVITMQIEGDPKDGIIFFVFDNLPEPNGTDQEPFEGFEEITLFNAAGKRIPISLPEWDGKKYGAFELKNTRIA